MTDLAGVGAPPAETAVPYVYNVHGRPYIHTWGAQCIHGVSHREGAEKCQFRTEKCQCRTAKCQFDTEKSQFTGRGAGAVSERVPPVSWRGSLKLQPVSECPHLSELARSLARSLKIRGRSPLWYGIVKPGIPYSHQPESQD